MGTLSVIGSAAATGTNSGTSKKRSMLRWYSDFLNVAKSVWPGTAPADLAAKTDVSVRAAEFWLAGKYVMSLENARALLRSEHGYEFLSALIGEDCDARWWKRVKLNAAHAEMGRKLKAQQRRLDELRILRDQIDMEIDPGD